jgi:hypothetical protein
MSLTNRNPKRPRMNETERNSIFNFVGSIGWLIDRTGEEEQILGSVWLAGDRQAAASAIPIIPYAETPEALIVRFPCSRTVWGVKEIEFHPGCDRWMAKRALAATSFYPPKALANQQHNLAILRLAPGLPPLDNASMQRIQKQLSKSLPQEESGFSGKATSLELTSIIQTLVNARRQGSIVICDRRKRPIARIFCQDGRISHARYGDLLNEDAIYRLMCSSFNGYFFFQGEKTPDWCDFPTMEKSTAAALMGAYRKLEEKDSILANIGGETVLIYKAVEEPGLVAGQEVQPDARLVWKYLYNGMPVSRLLQVCDLDGSQVMVGVQELLNGGFIKLVPGEAPPPFSTAVTPLPINIQVPLVSGQDIYAISLDPVYGPYFAPGKILGPRQSNDPWHQIHNIALPEEALGSPIFIGSEVVGVYCGGLIPGKYDAPEFAHGQQLLWAESVLSCTGPAIKATVNSTATQEFSVLDIETALRVTEELPRPNFDAIQSQRAASLSSITGENPVLPSGTDQQLPARDTISGVRQTASRSDIPILPTPQQDPRVSSGQIQSLPPQPHSPMPAQTTSGTHDIATSQTMRARREGGAAPDGGEQQGVTGSHSISSLLGSLSAVFPFGKSKKPVTQEQWFEIELIRAEVGSTQWTKATASTVFKTGDLLRLQIRMLQDAHLYALFQRSSTKTVTVLFPESLATPPLIKNSVVPIPSKASDQTMGFKSESGRYSLLGIPITSTSHGGTESLLLISSKTALGPLSNPNFQQSIFSKGTILLNGQRNLDIVEVDENALYLGLELDEVPANLVALAKLRVSHHN